MDLKLRQPGFWIAVLLVLLVLGTQIVLSIPLGIADVVLEHVLHRPPPRLEQQPLAVACINLIACGAAIGLGLFLNRLPLRQAFPWRPITALQVVALAITVLGAEILLSELDNVVRSVFPPPKFLLNLLKDLFFSKDTLASRFFLLVIIAPVTEELLFRGIILRGLLNRYRPSVAVILTGLLFAALHVNPWQFASALLLGITFGWFFLRTGSIALCVLAHAIANGITIVFTILPWDIPGATGTPDFTQVVFQPWGLDLAGLILFLAGLLAFRRATPTKSISAPPRPPVIGSINPAVPQ